MTVLYAVLALVAILVIVMLFKTFSLKGTKTPVSEDTADVNIDMDRALKHLQGAVRIPSVSVNSSDEKTKVPFYELHRYFEITYPAFHKQAQRTVINDCALIYKIEGSNPDLKPACFLGHMDVVPAQSSGWEHEPFSADTDEEFIYGRGTFDMKGQLTALLESLEIMCESGEKPVRTVYCCFGCDEEVSGESARAMCRYLRDKGVSMEFILDEGMTLVNADIVGIKTLALVGVCEKGYANIKVTAKGEAGHASMPAKHNSATVLAEAVRKINNHPMKAYWSEPVNCLIDKVAPFAKFPIKFVMANKWFFKPLLRPILCAGNNSTNAMLRTTFAFTMLKGSSAVNVIPDESSCIINCRLNTGESVEKVLAHIRKLVGDTCTAELLPRGYHEATKMSPVDTKVWSALEKSISESFGGAVTAPFPFPAATDSKFYSDLSDSIFKFSPHITNAEDRAVMHNVNEKFRLSAFEGDIKFYLTFLKNTVYCKEFK